jgi:outer membrane protein assembly factor BamB
VYALTASDGDIIWRYSTSHCVDSSPAVADNVVYVAADFDFLYALNASTGAEIWRYFTKSVFSSPSVSNGYVYIGSYDGHVYGFNASTGTEIWQYRTENTVSSSPAVAYGCVYVGSEDNNVYCLNASNGKRIWQSPTEYRVVSSPAVSEGNVYVGSEDNHIYCFNAFTGEKQWRFETGNYVDSSPAIVNGNLYIGSNDCCVYAFALGNSTDALPPQVNSSPWTTIVFDTIVCIVAAAIGFAVMYFVRFDRSKNKNAESVKFSDKNLPWFSKHADSICVLAILVFSVIFFINLGSGPLWMADEKIYSQWAFHMVKTGNYLVPWADGVMTFYIAKPPLFMWLMSLAYQLFGVNNLATRIWSPVFGILSLVTVFYFGKKLYNRYVGLLSALVLGTFTTFYEFATHAMTDIPLVFFIVANTYFLFLSENTTKNASRYVVLSGLFFGLALMTKQVQALLIPLIAFIYFISTKRSIRFLFTKRFTLFWGVGLLVFTPWLIYMATNFGQEFWQSYFIYNGVIRAVNPLEGHIGGYFFYFDFLVRSENPFWVILLPFAAGLCAFKSIVKHSKEDTLIIVWMSTVLAVFTLAQTKIYWYILPAFPSFALAVSSFLFQLLTKTKSLFKQQDRWSSSFKENYDLFLTPIAAGLFLVIVILFA